MHSASSLPRSEEPVPYALATIFCHAHELKRLWMEFFDVMGRNKPSFLERVSGECFSHSSKTSNTGTTERR